MSTMSSGLSFLGALFQANPRSRWQLYQRGVITGLLECLKTTHWLADGRRAHPKVGHRRAPTSRNSARAAGSEPRR